MLSHVYERGKMMKLTIEKETLFGLLAHTNSVVARRNTIPVLSNVLLEANKTHLRVCATDLDIEMTDQGAANVESIGSTTVSSQRLFDIIRKMPAMSQINLELNGTNLMVTSGRSRFSLPVLTADDFPQMSRRGDDMTFTMPAADLHSLIGRVKFAMSTEETRYYLNGIFLHIPEAEPGQEKLLVAAATDGHRLAVSKIEIPEGAEELPDSIIPRKLIGELYKIVENNDDDVTIRINKNTILFEMDKIRLIGKLIDGTFPDYTRVIPANHDQSIKIDRETLGVAIDRVSVVAAERIRSVKMSIEKNSIEVSVSSPENGVANERFDIDFDGDPIVLGFNSSYLLEILKNLEDDIINMSLNGASDPGVFTSDSHPNNKSILMPMRI